jgi:hypothetical protein
MPLPLNKKDKVKFSNVNWDEQVFQSKDLDCTLSTYTIRKNGTLATTIVDGDWVRTMTKKEEDKIRKRGNFCWPHKFVEKSRKTKIYKHTGDICFYDGVFDTEGNEWWVEFSGKFVNGKLQGKLKKVVIRLSQTANDIKKNNDEWERRLAEEEAKLSTRIRKALRVSTFGYWRFFWFAIGKFFRKFGNKLSQLDLWINRNIA